MEDRVKELEKQVESLQNNLGEMVRVQGALIKTINMQSDTILEMSKLNEMQSKAIEKITVAMGVYK